jgi:hypothetical protein
MPYMKTVSVLFTGSRYVASLLLEQRSLIDKVGLDG